MADDKPIFTFAHITDTHVESTDDSHYPGANLRAECLIDDINSRRFAPLPDFAVITGDLTGKGAGNIDDLYAFRDKFLARLDCPAHIVAGNHDIGPDREVAQHYPGMEDYEEVPLEQTKYAKVFGRERLHFCLKKENITFIGITIRNSDPDGALDFLDEKLSSNSGKKIIASHYGLYPARAGGIFSTWGFRRINQALPRFRAIVDQYRSDIIAYLYGHNHINSVVNIDGIYHMSAGAVARACTGFRYFRVFEDRIESDFYMLSRQDLWDRTWFSEDLQQCVDDQHQTPQIYHRGNSNEQAVTIHI